MRVGTGERASTARIRRTRRESARSLGRGRPGFERGLASTEWKQDERGGVKDTKWLRTLGARAPARRASPSASLRAIRGRERPRELWTARAASALWDGESAKPRLRRVLGLCAREGPRAADAENHGRSPATPSRRCFSERDRGMLLSRGRLLLVWEKCRSATASGELASGKRGAVAFFVASGAARPSGLPNGACSRPKRLVGGGSRTPLHGRFGPERSFAAGPGRSGVQPVATSPDPCLSRVPSTGAGLRPG